jgi:hypothetical protein
MCPNSGFVDLPMKTSLWGWHKTWFYCEKHEPDLPYFVGRLLEFNGAWLEELTTVELPHVAALTNKINTLKVHSLTGVCVAAHWLARNVAHPKETSPPGIGVQHTPRLNLGNHREDHPGRFVKLLESMFQNTSS